MKYKYDPKEHPYCAAIERRGGFRAPWIDLLILGLLLATIVAVVGLLGFALWDRL